MTHTVPWIVCDSVHHKNTQRIAEVIGRLIGADVVKPEQVQTDKSDTPRIVGLGSGIYFGAHSKKILELARTLPPANGEVFIFSTAGLPFLCWFFHRRLRRIVRSKGIEIVGEFHCAGRDTFGPAGLIGGIYRNHPNHRDLERAEEFARRMLNEHRFDRAEE